MNGGDQFFSRGPSQLFPNNEENYEENRNFGNFFMKGNHAAIRGLSLQSLKYYFNNLINK